MREAGVNIFSPEECLKTGYSSTQLDFDTEFCAGIPDFNGDGVTDGGKDACQGKIFFHSYTVGMDSCNSFDSKIWFQN